MRSLFKWFGGKYYMCDDLLPFPRHDYYFELFGGSAVILLNKIASKEEYYNDINSRLVNAWKVLQKSWLWYKLRGSTEIFHRDLFNEYKEPHPSEFEDAFRFFYVNRASYSGLNDSYSGIGIKNRSSIQGSLKTVENIHNRIKDVHFENQDYKQILKRILKIKDNENTLIYADPPYFKGGDRYEQMIGGEEWKESDFDTLYELLHTFEHAKIIVSIDDPNYLPNWERKEITRINKASQKTRGQKASRKKEYIFYNYDPKNVRYMTSQNQQSLEGFL